jgi:hypothetical protein
MRIVFCSKIRGADEFEVDGGIVGHIADCELGALRHAIRVIMQAKTKKRRAA